MSVQRIRWVLVGVLGIVLVTLGGIVSPHVAGAHDQPTPKMWAHAYPAHGAEQRTSPSSNLGTGDLIYHNGLVLQHPRTYVIFWGSYWSNGSGGVNAQAQLMLTYFLDMTGTRFANTLGQYYGASSATIANTQQYVGYYLDTAAPPTSNACGGHPTIADIDIRTELTHASTATGWAVDYTTSTVYVYTPPGDYVNSPIASIPCSQTDFCAYHAGWYSGSTILSVYAVMPYPVAPPCLFTGTTPNGDAAADSLVNDTAHEQFESITDPVGNGWIDASNDEIADKCQGPTYTTTLSHGGTFWLQKMYSNATHDCRSSYTGQAIGVAIAPNYYFLRTSNSGGNASLVAQYGPPGCVPLAGDWTGKGYDSLGVYCPSSAVFYLRNSNTTGNADIVFPFGPPNCVPIVGDWTHKGYDSVGVDCGGAFFLRNSNTAGNADAVVVFGPPSGCKPLAGDWTGKGYDSLGVYCGGAFLLKNTNTAGNADLGVAFGPPAGCVPLTGDWTSKGYDSLGVDCAGTYYLRNSNTAGNADLAFLYGPASAIPLVGDWM